MTHSKQAAKRVRQNNRVRVRNRGVRSAIKTAIKHTLEADSPEKRAALLRDAMKKTDKAAKFGVLHKNQAARRKSRLMKALNKLAAAGAK